MAKLIKKIIIKNQEFKQYQLNKTKLIAGSCPECMHVVTFYDDRQQFRCTNKECCFIANSDGIMIYSTEMKNKGIKKTLIVPTEDFSI